MSLITIPAFPPAPASMEFTLVSAVGMTRSPFSGKQQTFDWNAQWLEGHVAMPPMLSSDYQNWLAFLQLLRGPANTFRFTAAFVAAYPWLLQAGSPPAPLSWRLKVNAVNFSLLNQRLFSLAFDVVQAI